MTAQLHRLDELVLYHWPRLGSPRLRQHRADQEFDARVGEQKGQAVKAGKPLVAPAA